MAPRKNEIVEESYYTLILWCFFICEIKNNNKKILNYYDVQITKWLHLSFFIFKSVGRGGVVWWWLYLINPLQKTVTQLYRLIPSNSVLQLFSFDSGYSLVVLGKYVLSERVGGEERIRYDNLFSNIAFHFFTTIKLIYILVYQSYYIRYKKTRGTAMER